MAQAPDTRPKPLMISRVFPARRELVFRAWSTAEHMKRWFSPETYTTPDAEIDFRPGGVCAICMRSPEGQDFWSRGTFIEISAPDRLVFELGITVGGSLKFNVHTIVTFEDEHGGTRMTVHQTYDIHDPAFQGSIDGAPEGWRTTLDKLAREVARIQAAEGRSAVHATFTVERTYDASPAAVFHALTDQTAKDRWFGVDGCTVVERAMDVRPGGREWLKGRWANGTVHTFDAVYFDVVPNERIVYCYEMHLGEQKISVSLATMELKPAGTGTRLVVTEQGAFLDGYDDNGSRERGTRFLLDRVGASLGR